MPTWQIIRGFPAERDLIISIMQGMFMRISGTEVKCDRVSFRWWRIRRFIPDGARLPVELNCQHAQNEGGSDRNSLRLLSRLHLWTAIGQHCEQPTARNGCQHVKLPRFEQQGFIITHQNIPQQTAADCVDDAHQNGRTSVRSSVSRTSERPPLHRRPSPTHRSRQ